MTDNTPGTVVVVGGGVVGCAVAHALSGECEVTVLERDAIAGGATGHASGLVSPVYDHGEHLAAARYATEFFRDFEGVTFHERDGVFLVGPEEREHGREAARRASEAGFEATYLPPADLHERYPGTFGTDRFAGAAVFGDAGWVDPHSLTLALADAAVEAGAGVETGVEVTGLTREGRDGPVTGVETTEGRVEAGTVVVAAGWRTREFLSGLVEIPTRPFRYQTMTIETESDLGEGFPVAWEHDARLYWRATPRGNLHVGGQPYFVGDPGAVRERATETFRRTVATRLPEYLPSLGEPKVLTEGTCPTGDAATPDGVPIVDAPAEGPDGLVVATGMHGFGIMLAPVAGVAARARVTGDDPPFPSAPYALDRFADRSTDFGSSYIQEQ
jgi:glycine/D-amino acid oxidase-like deaminating enzyme